MIKGLPLERRLTRETVSHLPSLNFEDTRRVRKIVEVAQLKLLMIDGTTSFGEEWLILGVYHDAQTGMDYMIHTYSERPYGGFPNATGFDQIEAYAATRKYSKKK